MRPLLLTILFLLLSGCQYDPHAHLLTTVEPKNEDVAGIYVLDRADLPTDAKFDPAIRVEIRPDGTFSAYKVPPWQDLVPDATLYARMVNGEGRWEKAPTGGLDPGGRTVWGLYLRTPDNRLLPPSFTGSKAPYGLIFTLGDPDSGDAILLKRKP